MGLELIYPIGYVNGTGSSGEGNGGSSSSTIPTPTPSEPESFDNSQWVYKNNTKHKITYRDYVWEAGATLVTLAPVPSSLGLTCVNEGDIPDPILFCNDIVILPNEEAIVTLLDSSLTHNVHLTIQCITTRGTIECRFVDDRNNPIFIDAQGFSQIMPFNLCNKIILKNTISNSLNVNVTAIEVV